MIDTDVNIRNDRFASHSKIQLSSPYMSQVRSLWASEGMFRQELPYYIQKAEFYVGDSFKNPLPEEDKVATERYGEFSFSWWYATEEYRGCINYSVKSQTVSFEFSCLNEEISEEIFSKLWEFKRERTSEVGHINFKFWSWAGQSANWRFKDLLVDPWKEIGRNYSLSSRVTLDPLMDLNDPKDAGKILIFHGPAGTGKTSLIRSLAHSWKDWANFEVIQDPENMLNLSMYLTDVLIGDEDEDVDKWRIIIMEDCDELIRKSSTSQQLSKILNAGDGLLGQGSKVMFLMTANEAFDDIHPAISRPGRCLANAHIGKLSWDEAGDWMGGVDDLPAGSRSEGVTLAELYAIKRGDVLNGVKGKETVSTGMYV